MRTLGTNNPNRIAAALDLHIHWKRAGDEFGGCLVERRGGGHDIYVNSRFPHERRSFITAHEIMEFLARHSGMDSSPDAEAILDHGAACILMPRGHFITAIERHGPDLFALKRAFPHASHEAIARRIAHFVTNSTVTIVDAHRVKSRWRYRSEPVDPNEITRVEDEALGRALRTHEETTAHRDGITAAAYPIQRINPASPQRFILVARHVWG